MVGLCACGSADPLPGPTTQPTPAVAQLLFLERLRAGELFTYQLVRIAEDGTNRRVISPAGHDVREFAIAPGGGRVIYARYEDGTQALWQVADTGGVATPLPVRPYYAADIQWSPDGARIAGFDAVVRYHYLLDLGTQTLGKLPPGDAAYTWLSWSPSGDQLAAVGAMGLENALVIDLFDPRGTLVRHVATPVTGARLPAATWTRDAKSLFIATLTDVYAMTLADGSIRRLPQCCDASLGSIRYYLFPRLSPDESRMVLWRLGMSALDIRSTSDGALITQLPGALSAGAWSADGSRILYTRGAPAGDTALVTVTPTGQGERVVARGYMVYPTWLPTRSP